MNSKMNLPNKLTVLRIILVPVFIILMAIPSTICHWIALAVFVVAAITDTLDGQISRKHDIVTRFGKIMDPLADKLLTSAGLIMLAGANSEGVAMIPTWMVATIIFREFFVTSLRMFGSDNGKDVAAKLSGKIKTVFQMLTIVLGLVANVIIPKYGMFAFVGAKSYAMGTFGLLVNVAFSICAVAAFAATIWSLVDYFLRFKDDINVTE